MEQLLDRDVAARAEARAARREALGPRAVFEAPPSDFAHKEGAGVYCLCDGCDDKRVKARKERKKP